MHPDWLHIIALQYCSTTGTVNILKSPLLQWIQNLKTDKNKYTLYVIREVKWTTSSLVFSQSSVMIVQRMKPDHTQKSSARR